MTQTLLPELPIMGADDDSRRDMIVKWFVKAVARRLMFLEPKIKTVYFAVGRFAATDAVRLDYCFIVSEELSIGWPLLSSDKQNPMLADGSSDALVRKALKSLYGSEHPTFDASKFMRSFAPYTRDVHREGAPLNQAFAPYAKVEYIALDPKSWEAERMAFAVRAQVVGTVLSPELVQDEPVAPPGADPREMMDPGRLMGILAAAEFLSSQLNTSQLVLDMALRHKENPAEATHKELRRAIGIRDPLPPQEAAAQVAEDNEELGDL